MLDSKCPKNQKVKELVFYSVKQNCRRFSLRKHARDIFHGCNNDNFQLHFFTIFTFLLKTYIVGMFFMSKNKKRMFTPVSPSSNI